MDLSISNVISISVSQAGAGAGEYNTSNLAIFTHEPYADSFGEDGYKIYRESSAVATDFGTSSETYKMAVKVFSQSKNILANSGYLVVIPLIPETQTVTFDAVPDANSFKLTYGATESAAINFDGTYAEVQTALRAIAGLESVVVTGNFATGFVIQYVGVTGDISNISVTSNTLTASAVAVVASVAETVAGETLDESIARTLALVQYFGVLVTYLLGSTELTNVANALQAENKIGFFGSRTSADLDADGKFDLIRQASLSHTRCLYFGADNDSDVLGFCASYASRGLSTNFNGSNTTQTIHLKDLSGVVADSSMTETLLAKAQSAGVDVYISIQGVSKVYSSGENQFFDDVYNLLWFIGALQIAGFNVLAQTGTKISQTEEGVDSIKSAYRNVCERAVSNKFLSAGSWTSPDKFGIIEDFENNINERGYYIYSSPVALQSSAQREARQAPLIQIAAKYAGAVHSSSVIVSVNK